MTVAQLNRPPGASHSYSWTLVLPRPRSGQHTLQPETLTASEQMFFFGAPLAHVVAYEEHLRQIRHQRTLKQISRARRSFDFAVQLDALRQVGPACAQAVVNAG